MTKPAPLHTLDLAREAEPLAARALREQALPELPDWLDAQILAAAHEAAALTRQTSAPTARPWRQARWLRLGLPGMAAAVLLVAVLLPHSHVDQTGVQLPEAAQASARVASAPPAAPPPAVAAKPQDEPPLPLEGYAKSAQPDAAPVALTRQAANSARRDTPPPPFVPPPEIQPPIAVPPLVVTTQAPPVQDYSIRPPAAKADQASAEAKDKRADAAMIESATKKQAEADMRSASAEARGKVAASPAPAPAPAAAMANAPKPQVATGAGNATTAPADALSERRETLAKQSAPLPSLAQCIDQLRTQMKLVPQPDLTDLIRRCDRGNPQVNWPDDIKYLFDKKP